jgi:ribosomal protein S18 acetylase RimI-like enzyme
MISISEAKPIDFPVIREIAQITWPVAYGSIISKAQLDYMLEKFYSDAVLNDNFNTKNHRFLLVKEENNCIGFASYEHHYLGGTKTRLHKIYLLPESQRKGAGKLLLSEVEKLALENDNNIISLNVNRFNSAFDFYEKLGFEKVGEEDIELDFGYLMEDYNLEKKLT